MNSKPSGGYAVAQNNSNSNMSSASVTNASSSTQTNSPYKFERGYPAPSTAERAYNDTDLSRAIEAYKFFYPTMSTESLFQDLFAGLESKQSGIKFHAGPRHEFLTGNGDTPYGGRTPGPQRRWAYGSRATAEQFHWPYPRPQYALDSRHWY